MVKLFSLLLLMEEVTQYLINRGCNNFEPLKFGFWKRIIKYHLECDNYKSRKIFMKLVEKNYFRKVRINNRHFYYEFIPFGIKPKDNKPTIIYW